MLPKRLRQYSVPELERLASEFLLEHCGENLQIPIDVDYLLEVLPNVDFDVWPGFQANHQLLGIVMRDPATARIFIKVDEHLADRNPTRYRMTVAEELAHVVLHREIMDLIQSIEDFRALQNHADYTYIERNAKRFAAAILMPGGMVDQLARETYPQLVKVAGFTNADAIKKQMSAILAKRFEVSVVAMDYRLREWPARIYDRIDDSMGAKLPYLS